MKLNFTSYLLFLALFLFPKSDHILLVSGKVYCTEVISKVTANCEAKIAYNQTTQLSQNDTVQSLQSAREECCLGLKYQNCIKEGFPKDATCRKYVSVYLGATEGALRGAKCEQYTCGSNWAAVNVQQISVIFLIVTLFYLTVFTFF